MYYNAFFYLQRVISVLYRNANSNNIAAKIIHVCMSCNFAQYFVNGFRTLSDTQSNKKKINVFTGGNLHCVYEAVNSGSWCVMKFLGKDSICNAYFKGMDFNGMK